MMSAVAKQIACPSTIPLQQPPEPMPTEFGTADAVPTLHPQRPKGWDPAQPRDMRGMRPTQRFLDYAR
jgi:hypothetical protein